MLFWVVSVLKGVKGTWDQNALGPLKTVYINLLSVTLSERGWPWSLFGNFSFKNLVFNVLKINNSIVFLIFASQSPV